MAFSPDDFFAVLCELLPEDRPATFSDIATLVERVKEELDFARMPAAQQRAYVTDVLHLEAVLPDRASGPTLSEPETRETIRHWLAVCWPLEEED